MLFTLPVDLARHARIPATAADPAQLGEVVLWQPAPVEQA
jgi:hypothetical protein